MFGTFSNQLHQIQDEKIALRKRTEGEKLVQANGNLEGGKLWSRLGWEVVSNIFSFHPYLGKIPILTNIFQRG